VVLLVEAARDRRRHRLRAVERPRGGADEPVDPGEAAEAALLAVRPPAEEAARLEEQPAEGARLGAVGVEERERAEARPDPDPAAAPELLEGRRERPGVAGRRRALLQPV